MDVVSLIIIICAQLVYCVLKEVACRGYVSNVRCLSPAPKNPDVS